MPKTTHKNQNKKFYRYEIDPKVYQIPFYILADYLDYQDLLLLREIHPYFNYEVYNKAKMNFELKYNGDIDKAFSLMKICKKVIFNVSIQNVTWRYLSKLQKIESIDLTFNRYITDTHLGMLPDLTELKISDYSQITDKGLQASCANLTSLSILDDPFTITNSGLKNMSNLVKLILESEVINDNGIEHLKNLTELEIVGNRLITDNALSSLTSLTKLNLSNNNEITNNGLKKLENLKLLNLSNNHLITDDMVQSLTSITKLTLTNNNKITNSGLKNLENLISLNLSNNHLITDEGLLPLSNLSTLDLQSNNIITGKCFITIKLTALYLNQTTGIKDTSVLKFLNNLTVLKLGSDNLISNADIQNLNKLKELHLAFKKNINLAKKIDYQSLPKHIDIIRKIIL